MTNEIFLLDVHEGDLPVFFEQQLDPEATRIAAFPARGHDEFMAHVGKRMTEETTILKTIVFRGMEAGNVVSWVQSGEREVGHSLGREYWGKGIASAAPPRFLEHVKLRALYAHIAKTNAASIRVLQKCGFTITREYTIRGVYGEPGSEFVMTLEIQNSDEKE